MSSSNNKSFSEILVERVAGTISKSGVDRLMVALSGGADSASLLHILSRIRPLQIHAVHCNFHLRGKESNRDENFCRELCKNLNITLDVINFDVDSYRKQHKVSLEMACRQLRYDYFNEVCKKYNLQRIVTGHNANDNAETLLLNLMRGAGIDGLSAMKVDTGAILRPLLHIKRDDIVRYLHENDLQWVEDHTNAESEYSRNFLRNNVIPLLQSRWPGAIDSINKSIGALQGTLNYLNAADSELFKGNNNFLSWNVIEKSGDITTLLVRFLRAHQADISIIAEMSREIEKTIRANESFSRLSGRRWIITVKDNYGEQSGSTKEIRTERDGIYVVEINNSDSSATENNIELRISKESNNTSGIFSAETVRLTPIIREEIRKNRSNHTLWLPEKSEVIMRKPKIGDRIKPLGMKGSRLLSDVMSDAKLPRHQRENTWVAEDAMSGEIIWVENLKRSRLLLLSDVDSSALKITAK